MKKCKEDFWIGLLFLAVLFVQTAQGMFLVDVLAQDSDGTAASIETADIYASSGSARAADSVQSGAGWTLDSEGTLIVESDAGMTDWKTEAGKDAGLKTQVKSVVLSDGVTKIQTECFSGYVNLTDIEIPGTVKSIGTNAFNGCTSLTDIEIPKGVTSIEGNAFFGCTNLTSVEIPEGVTSIGNYMFYKCTNLTSVKIPEGVTSIGSSMFYQCLKLTDIEIPDTVTSIGENAFFSCTSLENVNIPAGVTTIGKYAFRQCTRLKSATIPEGVTEIKDYTFYRCANLADITIKSKKVTRIGEYAFTGCESLAEIVIPESVTEIGLAAFSGCRGLASVVMLGKQPPTLDSTFEYCKFYSDNVIGILVPEGTVDVYKNAWSRWQAYIGTDVGWSLDSSTGKLTIRSNAGMTHWINNRASNKSKVKSVKIENGVTGIGDNAFLECSSLTDITIPESVTTIGVSAFAECSSLTDVTIPENVTSIGQEAFTSCSKLTRVEILCETPPGTRYPLFEGCPCIAAGEKGILVPVGKVEAYGTAEGWGRYTTHITDGTPEITAQPADCIAKNGGQATFSVTATGKEPITYRWQVDKNDANGFVDIENADSAAYTILAADKNCDGYQYRCVIANERGSVTSRQAMLTVTDSDAEKVEAAKRVVLETLEGITATNDTAKEDIQRAVDTALSSAKITGVTVTVGELTKTEATKDAEGSISGSIAIECGSETDSVTIDKTIEKLPDSDAEKVEAAKRVVLETLEGITATNDTAKEDIQRAVDTALSSAKITGVTVTVGELTKTEATKDAEGSISGSIAIECGSETDSVTIDKTIEKLPDSDAEKVEAAKRVVLETLEGITATNDTAKEDIQRAVDTALSSAKITGVTVTVGELTKTEATKDAEGSISGSIAIECGSETDSVTIDKTIEKLPDSDAEKVEAAKRVVLETLEGITATNDTAKEDIQRAVDTALSSAKITGVTVTVGELTKTEATKDAEGSISGSIAIECGSETDSVTIGKTIAKLPVTEAGTVDKDVQTDGKAPVTQISTSANELAETLLTDAEKQQVANGTDIKIVLEVKDASDSVGSDDKALVETAKNGYETGQYLDISLFKIIGENRSAISETKGKITVTITIPDALKNTENNTTRTFAVIRVHDKKAELLEDLDESTETITIATDRFSTYAIVYKDTSNGGNNGGENNDGGNNGGENNDGGNNGSDDNDGDNNDSDENEEGGQQEYYSALTGDSTPVELYMILVAMTGFVCLFLYFTKRRSA